MCSNIPAVKTTVFQFRYTEFGLETERQEIVKKHMPPDFQFRYTEFGLETIWVDTTSSVAVENYFQFRYTEFGLETRKHYGKRAQTWLAFNSVIRNLVLRLRTGCRRRLRLLSFNSVIRNLVLRLRNICEDVHDPLSFLLSIPLYGIWS